MKDDIDRYSMVNDEEFEADNDEFVGPDEEYDEELVNCVCDCDPSDHDELGCRNCRECDGRWE
jgi:hypothetical protein